MNRKRVVGIDERFNFSRICRVRPYVHEYQHRDKNVYPTSFALYNDIAKRQEGRRQQSASEDLQGRAKNDQGMGLRFICKKV